MKKYHFVFDNLTKNTKIKKILLKKYKNYSPNLSEVIIVLGGDGFMLSPIYCPGAIEEFVDLVVPELQRRGLFRKRYKGSTQRDHLSQFD